MPWIRVNTVYRITGALTLNDRMRTLFGKAQIALEYALRRSGPMSMAPSQLGIPFPELRGKKIGEGREPDVAVKKYESWAIPAVTFVGYGA